MSVILCMTTTQAAKTAETTTMTATTNTKTYAVIADDQLQPVVWGLGATEEAALADARAWDVPDQHRVVEVTQAQARRIRAGEVKC